MSIAHHKPINRAPAERNVSFHLRRFAGPDALAHAMRSLTRPSVFGRVAILTDGDMSQRT